MANVNVTKIMNQLWAQQQIAGKIYMVLDAARDEQIYTKISELAQDKYYNLLEGPSAQDLVKAAPYLVELQQHSDFSLNLVQQAWGKSWGIFLASDVDLDELLTHLCNLLAVQFEDEPGRVLYFRYYDPRVLRVYLPTCNEAELQTIFGSALTQLWLESEDGDRLLEYQGLSNRV